MWVIRLILLQPSIFTMTSAGLQITCFVQVLRFLYNTELTAGEEARSKHPGDESLILLMNPLFVKTDKSKGP